MKSIVLELVGLVGGATRVHKPALLAAAATNSAGAPASHGTKAVSPEEVIPLEDEF
jgi:hypothetical protein